MADNKDKKVLNVPALRFPEFIKSWECSILEKLSKKIGDGIHSTPSYDDNGTFYFINGNNLNGGKIVITSSTKRVSEKEAYKNNAENLEANSILMSINGTIGNVALYHNEPIMLGKSACYINSKDNIDKNYLFYYLQYPKTQLYFEAELTGTTIKNLSLQSIRKTKIYIPTIEEQHKISRFLQKIDERISTQNKIIEKLQSLIKGLSQQLLSSENDWILYRLDDLAQIKSGYSGTQVSYQTPYKVSRIETISKHCIDIQRIGYVECIPESYRLNVGNILFSNINSIQYIGNTAYLDKDYGLYHGMNLLRIIPNTTIVRPRFLHLLLCTDWAINHFQTICNKAVSQASINQTALGKSRFPIPPMSVQQQICSMFELTERKLDNEQEYISCLQQQKRYLLQKMFI